MAETQPMRGADTLAKTLTAAGVDTIFAMSGNQIMIAFDALLDAQIRVVHIRHEAAAVHMADAWARLRDTVGVALVPAGPGFANALSALYTAHMSESPIVLLSGHAPVARLGLGAFQEMPQAAMADHFAKASWTVDDPADIAQSVARAMQVAASGRPGPVHISVPEDILGGTVDQMPELPEASFNPTPAPLDGTDGRDTLDALAAASRPLILAGPTLARKNTVEITAELEDATGVPVIRMESPRGANDPCLGAVAEVLAEADTVLSLGKLMDFSVQFGNALHADCEIVHIDPDAAMLDRSRKLFDERLFCAAQADAIPAAKALIEHANRPSEVDPGWIGQVRDAIAFRPAGWSGLASDPNGPVHAVELCRAVQARLDSSPDSVLIVDGGEFGQWAQACLNAPNRIINGPAGAIGSAIPFAVAAGLAKPDVPVIGLMGDGSHRVPSERVRHGGTQWISLHAHCRQRCALERGISDPASRLRPAAPAFLRTERNPVRPGRGRSRLSRRECHPPGRTRAGARPGSEVQQGRLRQCRHREPPRARLTAGRRFRRRGRALKRRTQVRGPRAVSPNAGSYPKCARRCQ